jgi:hypothetical protein
LGLERTKITGSSSGLPRYSLTSLRRGNILTLSLQLGDRGQYPLNFFISIPGGTGQD